MSGITKWSKIFYIFSFLFILNCAAFISHVWLLRWNKNAIRVTDLAAEGISSSSLIWAAAYIFDIITALIFITALTSVSCFDPIKKQRHLKLYVSSCILIIVLQLIAGTLATIFRQESLSQIDQSVNRTVVSLYGSPEYESVTTSFDMVQRKFSCCGSVNGPGDWRDSYWYDHVREPRKVVPITCCVLSNPYDYDDDPVPRDTWKCNTYAHDPAAKDAYLFVNLDPCEPEIEGWLNSVTGTFIGVAFGLLVMPIAAIYVVVSAYRHEGPHYDSIM